MNSNKLEALMARLVLTHSSEMRRLIHQVNRLTWTDDVTMCMCRLTSAFLANLVFIVIFGNRPTRFYAWLDCKQNVGQQCWAWSQDDDLLPLMGGGGEDTFVALEDSLLPISQFGHIYRRSRCWCYNAKLDHTSITDGNGASVSNLFSVGAVPSGS